MTPRTLIIAEVGLAHDGSFQLALDYVEACFQTFVDVVKFQLHTPEESTPMEPFRRKTAADVVRRDQWRRTAFSVGQWQLLKERCEARGLGFMTSVFSPEAVAIAREVGQHLWKVPSGQVNNRFMLDELSKTAGPVFISTGLATEAELQHALDTLGNREVTLLHCVTEYPTTPASWRLGQIERLSRRWQRPVGLSDHSGTIAAPLAAVARGQCAAIEVHVTLSKEINLPDAPVSLSMDDLRRLAGGVRVIEASRYPSAVDGEGVTLARRMYMPSLVAKSDIPKGTVIQLTHLAYRKAGVGPGLDWDAVVGRIATRDIPANAVFVSSDIEAPCEQSV